MKYEEIVGLYDYFQPVYDLENEVREYWKRFIPNNKFYGILSETINSFESNKPEERTSIWLQGTYGTGKSHATAVIKHLLFDDLSNISDFIEEKIEDSQIKFKITNFRKRKKVFPVILKGTNLITDNRTFALTIEKAVKDALKREKLEISTKTDFEKMILKLEGNEINWDNIFNGTELEIYGSKEDIINKLKKEDINILTKIENILSEKGIHFSTQNIANWLTEVRNKLKEMDITDNLAIYWDEFTGIFELNKAGLLLAELQHIAELSTDKGVYLFIVVHKRPFQTEITNEEKEKVLGRFKVLDYSMEPITTYHILNAAIKKNNKDRFIETKNQYISPLKSLIDEITGNEGTNVQKSLENLFPIHPYTAYLATFIARNIGSTERSLFKFLYDEKTGFKKFIKENPGENGNIFLTPDYLWDFFYEDFERIEGEKVYTVLEKFKSHKDTVEKKGYEYISILKGIFLLNILYRFGGLGESSLIVPSEENITKLFLGVIDQKCLSDVLSFIDEHQIVNKNPDNLYLITSSGLPPREIENEKKNIEREYNTIDKLLNNNQKKELENTITALVNRISEFVIMDSNDLNEHLIKRKVEKAFKKDYAIHLCLFLGKNEQELKKIKNILQKISNEDDFKNIIFVVSDVILDDKTFNKFIEYKARAIVADKHNYDEDRNTSEDYAKKVIDNWIRQVKSGYIEWFLQSESGKELINQLSKKINEELSLKIFSYGLENVNWLRTNRNIWKYQHSIKSIELFLFTNNRESMEEKTSTGINKILREIIKDNYREYIVDANLKIKNDVSENHPIKKMYLEIKKVFEEKKDRGAFNLGDTLIFLTKPPYGLYPNMVNMAAVGFLMREYIGKFFEVGTGTPIQTEIMRDKILALFDYWKRRAGYDKLKIRFGTEEEEELIKTLKDIFEFEDVKSLNDVKWKIRDWAKNKGFPIWVFKFAEDINENTKKAVDVIFEFLQLTDKEITYEKIKEYLNAIDIVNYDINNLIQKEDPKSLFENWLKNVEDVEISPEEIDDVISYIRKNMQEEVASWTEEKVIETVKNWIIGKQKLKIRDWAKNKGLPIWVFKFAEDINENTKKAVDVIFEFLQLTDKEITYEKIKECLNAIDIVNYDIETLIQKDPKPLFENWLKNVESIEISPEETDDVISYIRKNMQGDVAFWTEEKVIGIVKNWIIEKQKEVIKKLKKNPKEKNPVKNKSKIENLKESINKCNDIEKLKKYILKLIDEHSDILENT